MDTLPSWMNAGESQVSRQLRWALRPMQHILDDREITDLHINGASPDGYTTVFIKKNGKRERRAIQLTPTQLKHIAMNAAVLNRSMPSEGKPFAGGKFPDGQRVQVVCFPALPEGKYAISVRRGSKKSPTPQDLEDSGVFDQTTSSEEAKPRAGMKELLELKEGRKFRLFIEAAFRFGFNGLFAGIVNTGKTHNLRAFCHSIPKHKRVVTVEDNLELADMPQDDVVNLLYPKDSDGISAHNAEHCVEAGLRMDMDEILNGEVRDQAAWALLRAGASGHPFKTSCHAPSALGAFDAMYLMARQHPTARALEADDLKQTLRQLIDFVVFSEVVDDKRRITQVWFDPTSKTGLPPQVSSSLFQEKAA